MGVTIKECLQLPSLQDAEVVAGHDGLNQYISTVSVLEYARVFAMADALFLGGELILTAFTSVMDDVEAQCNAIRRLHDVGEVGLILYYVGYYVKAVDQRLIDTANELSFPLILMSPNTYYHRYSEVITEVIERILEDRKNEERSVPAILDQIARMRERQRNIPGILRVLSDRFRYSLLLLDKDGRECGLATWPMAMRGELIDEFRDVSDKVPQFPVQLRQHDKAYTIRRILFSAQSMKNMRLYVMTESDKGDHFSEAMLHQAIEVLQVSYNIWRQDLLRQRTDDLIRVILNDDQNHDVYRLASNLHIDLKAMRIMWVLRSRNPMGRTYKAPSTVEKVREITKEYLQENRKSVIIDTFDNGVVVFMNDADHFSVDEDLVQDFSSMMAKDYPDLLLVFTGGLDDIIDVRRSYMLIEEYCASACVIWPYKKILTHWDISFAKNCYEIMHGEQNKRDSVLSALDPLLEQRDTESIVSTLTAYLIDSEKNTNEAANLLHVHDSTVKYRINKVNRRLGYDCTQMPASYGLYLALAVRRLIANEEI